MTSKQPFLSKFDELRIGITCCQSSVDHLPYNINDAIGNIEDRLSWVTSKIVHPCSLASFALFCLLGIGPGDVQHLPAGPEFLLLLLQLALERV
ncbi:MAG: hypothetical protein RM049_01830 [Nostoc sp. DedQUE04]|nr:hypothetical protein [Nostoc sp. DedQUE04]MDZ8134024.1 hypothetical protein [Nostoc sp. DedQUE04]